MISVIVPAFNVEKYLEKSLDSICAQTFGDFEVILIDDGSTDHTGAIADSYAERDSRIRVIHTENAGLSEARNRGMDEASGDYITFVDSDDYLTPNAFELMYGEAMKNDLDIVVGGAYKILKNGTHLLMSCSPGEKAGHVMTGLAFFCQFYKDNVFIITAWGKLLRRSFLNETGARFLKGIYHEDLLWTPGVFFKAARVSFIPDPVYYYVLNPNSITNSKKKAILIRDRVRIYHILEDQIMNIENREYRETLLAVFAKEYMFFSSELPFAFSGYASDVRKSYVRGKFKTPVLKLRAWIYGISLRLSAVLQSVCVGCGSLFKRGGLDDR